MAASLGRLTLDLVAKIASFTEPLAQAERQANSSTQNIAKSFDVASFAAKSLGTAVAGISLGGMVAYANQVVETGNDIKKFAELSNTSIQQFQYYAAGAETAGISMESFADKMKDMQDRIGDFQQTGGGPLADFFTNIAPQVGVTIQQFQKLSGPEALQLYYNSLQKVGASQNDMKFYMEAIISDSSLLLPLLKNGGEGFKKWGDAAQKAGAIMSDDMVGSLALAKENLNLLHLQWQGLETNLINNAVPALQLITDHTDEIKSVSMVLGSYMVGSLIPVALKYVGVSVQRVSALIAERQQTLLNTEIEAVRAARMLQLTAAELANAEAQLARLTGMQRIAFMEKTLIPLRAAHTAALEVDTVAQQANNAAKLTAANVGRGLLGVLGGPVGLGLTVASVAASYLLLKDNTKDTAQVLDTQSQSVDELRQKYEQLNSVQKDTAIHQLTEQVEELRVKYVTASSDLSSYIDYIQDSGRVSEQVARQIQQQYQQYVQGKITADQFYSAVKSINGVNDEQLTKIRDLITANASAKASYDKQKDVLGQLNKKTDEATQKQNAHTIAIDATTLAFMRLTQKQREAVQKVQDDIAKESWIQNYMTRYKRSRDEAEYLAQFKQDSGMGFSNQRTDYLSKAQYDVAMSGYQLQKQSKAREESEKKIEEAQKKQLEYQTKLNQLVGASSLNGLRIKSGESVAGGKVHQYTADFAQLTQQTLGSDLNRFTAFNDSYHKGTNSKHAVGQAFDFTVKNAKDAQVSINRLQEVAKKYGFVIKTINEYSNPSSRATGGHVHVSVLGYKGSEEALKDAKAEVSIAADASEELKKLAKDRADKQIEIRGDYYGEDYQRATEHKKKLEELGKTFTGDELKRLTAVENTRYEQSTKLAQLQIEQQIYGWQWTGEEKLKKEAEINKRVIDLSTSMNDTQKALAKKSIDDQLAYELKQYQNTQQLKVQDLRKTLAEQTDATQQSALQTLAERSMTPSQLKAWQFQNQYDQATGSAWESYQSNVTDINKKDSNGNFEISSENERYKLLLEAEQAYQAQKAAIQQEYAQKEQDLTLQTYSGNLSTMSSAFGSMAELVKGYVGESSTAYTTLVGIQKGANLASVMMNSYAAISAAWASAPFPYNLPAVAMTTVQTGVLQAALQAFTPNASGYATGGHITGKGTGTSDEIPIWASNGEFMMKATAVSKLGLANLNYMNATGELPDKFADGGFIGSDVMSTKALNTQRSASDVYALSQEFNQTQAIQPQHLVINNLVNWDEVPGVMAGSSGQKVTLNTISRNKSQIRAILGV
ncbi:hypothetical protein LVY74_11780 [Acinetobacter sp. ME22]|uniref:hypothetical protein n=1 Tax=Acinetobacter sp. ME22 TaxID=2904802 RepID=UPI001EDB7D95|nr:hypothetical protein [Acinetobacter sp. ME22]MCG2574230.1 hypothetical protein [Acinetobacter sp. ME22]